MNNILFLSLFVLMLFVYSCASVDSGRKQKDDYIIEEDKIFFQDGNTQVGIASWYGIEEHNRRAASGEKFSKYAYTAAHKTLPMGTIVRVTNLENGRDVIVKINDRGPFVRGRIVDLSHAAAKSIGMVSSGTAKVKIEIISSPTNRVASIFKPLYTLQIGSFNEKSNAINTKRKLEHSVNDVRIERVDLVGNVFYRVRVGRYSSKSEAEEVSRLLSRKGYKNVRVILE
ncbi:MAG: septal ring lytic transglycosylase RlpA family protein [Thermodesulfobacteriota bacterium]